VVFVPGASFSSKYRYRKSVIITALDELVPKVTAICLPSRE